MATIGVIGLGKMGRAIAERLKETGHDLVVWNRSPGRADGLGAEEAATPADVAGKAKLIIAMLSDDAAVDAVYRGEGGLLSTDLSGVTVIEMCTMSPDRARELEADVKAAGGAFVECPVGGTVGPARQGALLGLAAGDASAFEAAKPVLDHLTRRLEHLGPVGKGAAMKLAVNLPLMVYWSALGEALGLAMSEGIEPRRAMDILADSSGAIGSAKARSAPIVEAVEGNVPDTVNFALETALKDMGEMVALAQLHGLSSDVIDAARSRAARAFSDGWEGRDVTLTAAFGNAPRNG